MSNLYAEHMERTLLGAMILAPSRHAAYNENVSPRDFVAPIGISGVRLQTTN